MNDSQLKTTEEIAQSLTQTEESQLVCPDGLPEKFWDRDSGAVRVDALSKSYLELERKLGREQALCAPESADDYEVTIDGKAVDMDQGVNKRLHSAGLNQQQVQTVYELAHEVLTPAMADLEANNQTEKLIDHFGGEDKWNEARRQIAAWGRENYSEDVFSALSNTCEGVLTMQRMMSANEPGLGRAGSAGHGPDEAALKKMMSDKRYWRDQDPAYIAKVRAGFRALYPGS